MTLFLTFHYLTADSQASESMMLHLLISLLIVRMLVCACVVIVCAFPSVLRSPSYDEILCNVEYANEGKYWNMRAGKETYTVKLIWMTL